MNRFYLSSIVRDVQIVSGLYKFKQMVIKTNIKSLREKFLWNFSALMMIENSKICLSTICRVILKQYCHEAIYCLPHIFLIRSDVISFYYTACIYLRQRILYRHTRTKKRSMNFQKVPYSLTMYLFFGVAFLTSQHQRLIIVINLTWI